MSIFRNALRLLTMGVLGLLGAAPERIPVGGQAVIEGVLMRGPKRWGLAVRREAGDIWRTSWEDARWAARGFWKLPVARGVATMAEMISVGMKALSKSAEIALGEDEEMPFWGMALSILMALVMVVGLFLLLPVWIAEVVLAYAGHADSTALKHVVEGITRAGVFVAYIAVIGFWKDIQRVFAYHGAEHKTINAYEQGAELTPESVASFSRIHPRCGTSFLLVVVVVSILVFAAVGNGPAWWKALSRILFLPVVIGISYEFIRWTSRAGAPWDWLMRPALCLQYLTTREPDLEQIAVGITSLDVALKGEESTQGEVRSDNGHTEETGGH